MLKKIYLKLQLADKNPLVSLLNAIYFNLIKINRFPVYEFDLKNKIELPVLDKIYEIKVLPAAGLEEYLPKNKTLSREFTIHKIYGIKECVVVLKNNIIVHISWIFVKGNKNRWFDLQKGEASLNYSFTFPEFRGQNLYPCAILVAAQYLKNKGFNKILEAHHENTSNTYNSFQKIKYLKKVGVITQWFIFRPKFIG